MNNRFTPLQSVYKKLSTTFTRNDVERQMRRLHLTYPVEPLIFRLKYLGLIRSIDSNTFCKLQA